MYKLCTTFNSMLRCNACPRSCISTIALGRKFSFKSDLSLEKIYPNSRQQLYTPEPPTNEGDKFSGYIPMKQLEITYSRSSGPGGQHVNCVNTKVEVRFKVSEAEWIPEKTRKKMMENLQNKLNRDGYFIIKSDLTRSQQMNVADALEKLRTIIRGFEVEPGKPSEETLEKVRRRQERAARERLLVKRQRSQIKADRQGPSGLDM